MIITALNCSVFGQKEFSDLAPEHRRTLEGFLARNKIYEFLSETKFDAGYLREAKEGFGASTPYYHVKDFNRDKFPDFAVVLSRKAKPKKATRYDVGTPFEFNYPLTVMVFNGSRTGTFRLAFKENIDAPLVSFLGLTWDKQFLTFGSVGRSTYLIIKPKKKGYFAVYPDEP